MRFDPVRPICVILSLGLWLAVAVGCGGGQSGGVPTPETVNGAGAGDATAPGPALPVDAFVDPAEILARRGSEMTDQVRLGAEAHAASGNTSPGGGSLEFTPGGADAGAWALYQFTDLTDSDFPLSLELNFDTGAGLPDGYYLGLSNYTAECWDWVEVAVPTGTDTVPVPQDIDRISPGGGFHCVVMVLDEAGAVLDDLTLGLDSFDLPAPLGLAASAGTSADLIQLTWDDPAISYTGEPFTGVIVERALDPTGPWVEIAEVGQDVTSYADESVADLGLAPATLVYYRLRTALDDIHGSPGLAVAGWLTLPDVELLMASDDLAGRIRVTWTPVEGAESYLLEYRAASGSPTGWTTLYDVPAEPEPSLTHTKDFPPDQGYTFYTRYEYRVKAAFAGSLSADWSPVDSGSRSFDCSFDASDGTAPDQISLSWYGTITYDSFIIYYRNAEGGTPADWTLLQEYEQTYINDEPHNASNPAGKGAEYGTVYAYRLYGVIDGEQTSDYLDEDTGYRALGDVSNLMASDNDSARIALAWDAVAEAQGYRLQYRNLDGGSPENWTTLVETDAETLAFDHTALAPAGQEAEDAARYEYRAKGLWLGEASENWSPTATGTMTFGDVAGFTATDGWYTDRTVLGWDQLAQAEAYEIEYRNLDGGTPADWTALTEISDGVTTSFDHTETDPPGKGCVLMEQYEYRIRGRQGTGYSPGWADDRGHAGAGPGDWCMDGRDPLHQRRSAHIGPETPELLWTAELDESATGSITHGAGGVLYVCDTDGTLYALNSEGGVSWKYEALRSTYSVAPLVDGNGYIYVAGLQYDGPYGDGFYLHAVNPDGSNRWTRFAGYANYYSLIASPCPAPDGSIVWAHSATGSPASGRLYATHADGTHKWAYSDAFNVAATPAVNATGTVYATCSDYAEGPVGGIGTTYRLHAINPDGTMAWSAAELGQGFSPSIGDDGRVYVRLGHYESSVLYCYEPDGTLAWDLELADNSISALAIGADGCVYAGCEWDSANGWERLYAVNPEGTIRWTYEQTVSSTSSAGASPAIDGAGTIYCPFNGGLHAINPDGTQKWVYPTTGQVLRSPSIGDDGVIYFSVDDTVYALGPGVS